MSITSIAQSLTGCLPTASTTATSAVSGTAATTSTAGPSTTQGHRHHGGGLMRSVMEALQQSGATDGSASGSSADSSSVGAAMASFMQTLMQTLQSGSTPGNSDGSGAVGSVASSGSTPYASLSGELQSLASGSAGSSGSALDTAFQNLVTALNGSPAPGTANSPNLQTFLQNLSHDLANRGQQSPGVGNVISTQS